MGRCAYVAAQLLCKAVVRYRHLVDQKMTSQCAWSQKKRGRAHCVLLYHYRYCLTNSARGNHPLTGEFLQIIILLLKMNDVVDNRGYILNDGRQSS